MSSRQRKAIGFETIFLKICLIINIKSHKVSRQNLFYKRNKNKKTTICPPPPSLDRVNTYSHTDVCMYVKIYRLKSGNILFFSFLFVLTIFISIDCEVVLIVCGFKLY